MYDPAAQRSHTMGELQSLDDALEKLQEMTSDDGAKGSSQSHALNVLQLALHAIPETAEPSISVHHADEQESVSSDVHDGQSALVTDSMAHSSSGITASMDDPAVAASVSAVVSPPCDDVVLARADSMARHRCEHRCFCSYSARFSSGLAAE